mgnify:FL=1
MDFQTAVKIVTADQNEGEWGDKPTMTSREVVEHVRNIMRPEDVVDHGDENTEAYRRVLLTRQLPE